MGFTRLAMWTWSYALARREWAPTTGPVRMSRIMILSLHLVVGHNKIIMTRRRTSGPKDQSLMRSTRTCCRSSHTVLPWLERTQTRTSISSLDRAAMPNCLPGPTTPLRAASLPWKLAITPSLRMTLQLRKLEVTRDPQLNWLVAAGPIITMTC